MQNSINLRHQIPALTLRTFDGRSISSWDFKQKRNRVIAFLHADSSSSWKFIHEVVARAADWKSKDAIGLIVFSKTPAANLPATLPPEIIAGVDSTGRSVVRYLGDEATGPDGLPRQAVFVADRYGELYAKWIFANNAEPPSIPEILKALEQIEIACEECEPSTWPLEG